jgi:hypothetical protein
MGVPLLRRDVFRDRELLLNAMICLDAAEARS